MDEGCKQTLQRRQQLPTARYRLAARQVATGDI
jgi:hypothetical protein